MRPNNNASVTLGVAAQGLDTEAKENKFLEYVDFDARGEDPRCSKDVTVPAPHDTGPEVRNACQLLGYAVASGSPLEEYCQVNGAIDDCKNETNGTDTRSWNSVEEATAEDGVDGNPSMESATNSGSVNATLSDTTGSKKENPPSPSKLLQSENMEGCDKDQAFGGFVMEDSDSAVCLHTDYILYQDRYIPAAMMVVSDMYVRIEGLPVKEDAEPFAHEWGIDDVYCIESQWCAQVNVVRGRLCLLAKGSGQNKIAHNAAGIEEIKFAVFDPSWVYRQKKIMSLNGRYEATWKILPPIDIFDGVDALPINKSEFFSRPYFPNFEEHFDEVVYPEGDVDAVSICKRDVDLLQPETFVNDTIIDFYIKYLKNKIVPEDENRFHFFNSFFFRKLADLDKNPESAFDGKAAFQRVRKWTRKLNLFEKDFIFIPVNYSLHWSLIVICHPGEVAGSIDGELNKSSKVPCILHMDSIRGSHSGLKNLIQSYLREEWKERHKDMPEDISMRFLNLRFLSLELPQQENCYDCGLFLLHYVELFMEDAPHTFDPFKISKFSNFLTVDWFMPAEVSLKRAYIQRLISKILRNYSQRKDQSGASDELQLYSSKRQKHSTTDEVALGLSSGIGDSHNSRSTNTCYLGSAQDMGVSVLETSSYKTSQSISQPLLSLYDPGSSSCSSFGQYQQYEMGGAMSPIQEEDEDNEHIVYSGRRTSHLSQLNYAANGCSNIEPLGNHFSWGGEEEYGDEVEDTDDHDDDVDEEGVLDHEEDYHEDENLSDESGLISDEESGLNSDDDDNDDYDDDDVKLIEESSLRREAHHPHGQMKNQNHHDLPQRCPLIDNLDSLDDSFACAPSGIMETRVGDSEEEQQDSDGSDDDNSESEDLVGSTSEVEKNSDGDEEPKQAEDVVTGEVSVQELDVFSHENGKLEGDASHDRSNERVESGGDFYKKGPCEDEHLIVCDSDSDDDEPPTRSSKRPRLSPPMTNHEGLKITGSLFKDVEL